MRARIKFDDPKAWQNQFYESVTCNINKEAFKPLFKDSGLGRGNASIRQLVAIMTFKEGNRDFAADNLIDLVTSGLQGKPSRYELMLEGEDLTVVLQMHVDELHEAGDFPEKGMGKGPFGQHFA